MGIYTVDIIYNYIYRVEIYIINIIIYVGMFNIYNYTMDIIIIIYAVGM